MNAESQPLTRREALLTAIKGSTAAMLAIPFAANVNASETLPAPEPEFVPENDYPFFGWEPGSAERSS